MCLFKLPSHRPYLCQTSVYNLHSFVIFSSETKRSFLNNSNIHFVLSNTLSSARSQSPTIILFKTTHQSITAFIFFFCQTCHILAIMWNFPCITPKWYSLSFLQPSYCPANKFPPFVGFNTDCTKSSNFKKFHPPEHIASCASHPPQCTKQSIFNCLRSSEFSIGSIEDIYIVITSSSHSEKLIPYAKSIVRNFLRLDYLYSFLPLLLSIGRSLSDRPYPLTTINGSHHSRKAPLCVSIKHLPFLFLFLWSKILVFEAAVREGGGQILVCFGRC